MPRRPRIHIPGVPLHLIQRGVARNPVFFSDDDCMYYLEWLGHYAIKRGVDIHAYCLMTNHIHLLVSTPSAPALSGMMQDLGRSYVPYINRVYGRSGGLWEGRFKSCLVQTEEYFLSCMRYIEMNPVRAAMVASPGDYRWSSYKANALGLSDPVLTFHEEYLLLGKTLKKRQQAYRDLFETETDSQTIDLIRMATQQGVVAGEGPFVEFLQEQAEKKLNVRKRGRPQKQKGV